MKFGKVFGCCALLGTLLIPSAASAQVEDDFLAGFSPCLPWTWNVPGNVPGNTEDPTNYAFSTNSLAINAQPGSLYGSGNMAHNIPSLLILDQPDNWYVETAVRTDWSMASPDKYVAGGLIFFADADNYFSYYNNRDAGNSPSVQVSSTYETFGNPSYGNISSPDWSPTTDYVKLRIEGTPTAITFLFDHTGTWQTAGTISSTTQPDEFAFLSSLIGLQVGLETDTGGGFNNSPFSFGYFKTNLVVAVAEDDFLGGFNPCIPWSCNAPGNNPADTEDPTHYAFSPNSLDITVQSGSFYAGNNTAHNIPSVLVLDQPANWYVETAVSTDWSMASLDRYVFGGLVFFADADNYFSFYNNRNAGTGHTPLVQVSSTFESAGTPTYGFISSIDWDPTQDFVKLRVEGSLTGVRFLYDHTGNWQVAGTLSSSYHPEEFAFMSNLIGMQVGLETDSGGGFNGSPFSFSYFKTNLVVMP